MLRVCLIALVGLWLLTVSLGVRADELQSIAITIGKRAETYLIGRDEPLPLPGKDPIPLRITEDPGADLAPVIAVSPDGRVAISWQYHAAEGSEARLVIAQSPKWNEVSVAPLLPSHAARTRVSLAVTEKKGTEICLLAWSQPMTDTLAILRCVPGQKPTLALTLPVQVLSDFALDTKGGLHVAWAQGAELGYWDESGTVTATIPITIAPVVADLSLGIAETGEPRLAWVSQGPSDQLTGIFYATSLSISAPIQIAPGGYTPRLLVGPSGRAHLCWLTDEGLFYANSQDWGSVQQVVTTPLSVDAFAFAIGPGEVAHIVWVEEHTLWYANSADWHGSKRPLVRQVHFAGVSMAIDRSGRPHIAWSALDDKGNADIYYLCPTPRDPQLRITYPLQGEVLTDDVFVKAESNLLPGELLRVEFYLQLDGLNRDPSESTLLHLGVDRDGRDGWSVPLRVAELMGNKFYRVLAFGVDLEGRTVKALGDPFTVRQASVPWIWLQAPNSAAQGKEASIVALVGSPREWLRRLDLFLVPLGCSSSRGVLSDTCPLPPQSLYVGSYGPLSFSDQPTTRWQQMVFDSRRLADGAYGVLAVATDRSARRGYGVAALPLLVDNSFSPAVEVVSPSAGAVVKDTLRVSARASDLDGRVQRVDFYAERAQSLLQGRYRGRDYALDMPYLIWLGSDTDGSDGWAIQVPVDERLDGDTWYIRAVAIDDQGLTASARSPVSFVIVGQDRPYMQLVSPLPGSTLRLTETVKLSVSVGARQLMRVQLYLQDPSDNLTYLGEMHEEDGLWLYEWDTRSFPDGDYALLAVGHRTDGHKSLARSDKLSLKNAQPLCDFAEPSPGKVLKGSVPISLTQGPSTSIVKVEFYYKDTEGQLRFIGRDEFPENGWGITWDTTTVLDGAYTLVAWVVDVAGHTSWIEREVVVHNVTPSISLRYFTAGLSWRGVRRVFWEAESPLGRPLSITMEYSPDDGSHWITVNRDIPAAAESFAWNTAVYPDSLRARLRLWVTDGFHSSQVTSPPFVLNNVNEPPRVTFLAPGPGKGQDILAGGQVYIAWQAYDPDGDALTIDLDYRRGQGDWLPLAHQLPDTGSYVWQIEDKAPDMGDYALRITAKDPAGGIGIDSVEGIRLIPGKPPTVRLLSPKGRARLEKEAVILWRATSEDDKELLIDLYYSDNAGQTWLPLAEGLPNSGYYVWQTSYLPAGSQYRVRVVARGRFLQAAAESEDVFSIGSDLPPQITWLSPAPESNVSGIQCVRWSVSNPGNGPLSASLRLSPAGKADWRPLALDIPNDGFYLWDTRNHPDGTYDLQVTISNGLSLVSAVLPQPLTISNRLNHPPQVELISPQGGEHWSGMREVLWRAWDVDGDVLTATLYLGVDGGREWVQVATLDARAGRILWDTSQAPPGREYQMRIVVSDSQATAEDSSPGTFRLIGNHPPQARFISPDPQGKLLRGNLVTWVAEDVDGDSLTVSLAVSDDEGVTWKKLVGNLFNAGEYALDLAALKPGHSYRLRLCVSDGLDEVQVYSAPFRLTKLAEMVPEVEIISPRSGEKCVGTQMVRWRASDPAGQSLRVDVEFSRDGGQNWMTLAEGIGNTGMYRWDTRDLANGIYLLRLTADNGQARGSEVSEPFVLDNPGQNAPVVSLTCPKGGEVWSGTREITWRTLDVDGGPVTTTLFYSLDMGNTWQTLAQGLSGKSYLWDTTTIPNCERVWLRVTASDGRLWSADMCDGPFAVRNPHAPLIKLLAPVGGEQVIGKQRIIWAATQHTGRPIKVKLEVSSDAGQSWSPVAANLPPRGSYLWDTNLLPEGSRVLLRATASDGLQSAIDLTAEPLIVRRGYAGFALPFYLP